MREICRNTKLTMPSVSKHTSKGMKKGAIISEKIGQLKICKLNFKSPELVPIVQNIELTRYQKFPNKIQDSFDSFIADLKERPLLALIFGSFAKNTYTKRSDLDILLVFQRIDSKLTKNIEISAAKIKGRTMVNIQPVSLGYNEFEKEILNKGNEFMKDIRKNSLVLNGLDIYLKLIWRFYE